MWIKVNEYIYMDQPDSTGDVFRGIPCSIGGLRQCGFWRLNHLFQTVEATLLNLPRPSFLQPGKRDPTWPVYRVSVHVQSTPVISRSSTAWFSKWHHHDKYRKQHWFCEQCENTHEAWWPNKLSPIIELTKLLTHYVRSMVKRDLVLNVTIWALYIINATISRHISDPRVNLGTMSHLEAPRALRGKWPSQCASRAKGISCSFQIMKIDQVASKICPRQGLIHWAFYLEPMGPQGPIFCIHLRIIPVHVRTSFLWIQWFSFAKSTKNDFLPILALFIV